MVQDEGFSKEGHSHGAEAQATAGSIDLELLQSISLAGRHAM